MKKKITAEEEMEMIDKATDEIEKWANEGAEKPRPMTPKDVIAVIIMFVVAGFLSTLVLRGYLAVFHVEHSFIGYVLSMFMLGASLFCLGTIYERYLR